MATVEQIARRAIQAVNGTAGLVTVGGWVTDRYIQLCHKARRLRHLRAIAQVSIAGGLENEGTFAVTAGSPIAVPDADALLALEPLRESLRGRFVRFGLVWYQIAGMEGDELRLTANYAEATNDEAGYVLVGRYVDLPTDVMCVASVSLLRHNTPLKWVSPAELQWRFPNRTTKLGRPMLVCEGPVLGPSVKTLELYPSPKDADVLEVRYWRQPRSLELGEAIPSGVADWVLVNGVVVDLCLWESTQALAAGKAEIAATWLNLSNQYRTRWDGADLGLALDFDETKEAKAVQVDTLSRRQSGEDFDSVTDAEDYVWNVVNG